MRCCAVCVYLTRVLLSSLLLSEAGKLVSTGAAAITADNWLAELHLVFKFELHDRVDYSHTTALRRWLGASIMHCRFAWCVCRS